MDPPTSSSIPSDTMTFLAALLDTSSPTTDQVFKTSMSLSTDPATSSGSAASIEPLPHINYLLLNNLIALAKPHLSARRLKRMDYLVDARRGFYDSHVKFAIAYRDLSDTTAAGDLLDKKADELKKRLADAQGQHDEATAATVKRELDAVQAQRMANNEEMRIRLQALNERTRCRQHTAAWFSEFKTVFLRDEMPWLVELGKESYRSAMEQQQQQATKSGATAPSSSSATATPVSPAVKKLMEKVEADSGGVRVGAGIANDMGGEPSTSMAMQQEQATTGSGVTAPSSATATPKTPAMTKPMENVKAAELAADKGGNEPSTSMAMESETRDADGGLMDMDMDMEIEEGEAMV